MLIPAILRAAAYSRGQGGGRRCRAEHGTSYVLTRRTPALQDDLLTLRSGCARRSGRWDGSAQHRERRSHGHGHNPDVELVVIMAPGYPLLDFRKLLRES